MSKGSYKVFAVLAVSVLSHTVTAAVPVRVDVPLPVYADGESSAYAAAPGWGAKDRTLKITLSFDASPTNNVEVALGAGPGGDFPDPDNTTAVIGWDCGEWSVTLGLTRERFAAGASNPSSAGRRTLEVRVRVDANGTPVDAAFTADSSPITFQGLESAALFPWLSLDKWGAFVVTSRGGGNASAGVSFLADGTNIILR